MSRAKMAEPIEMPFEMWASSPIFKSSLDDLTKNLGK